MYPFVFLPPLPPPKCLVNYLFWQKKKNKMLYARKVSAKESLHFCDLHLYLFLAVHVQWSQSSQQRQPYLMQPQIFLAITMNAFTSTSHQMPPL